ncbi:MAG: CBS domain-containing protein [Syntrophomonadaceae bacterium]
MQQLYSREAYRAFFVLLIMTFLVGLGLVGLKNLEICTFSRDMTTLDGMIFSLPLIAIYIVVFLAATAGYARAKYMIDELPFNQRLNKQLQSKSMEKASIKAKIRAGAQVTEESTLSEALNNLISSRISILAVVDRENRIQGVITSQDILLWLQETLRNDSALKNYAQHDISRLLTRTPITADCGEDLQSVVNKMIKHQFTKLVVADSEGTFCGTIDSMDLIAEIFDENC